MRQSKGPTLVPAPSLPNSTACHISFHHYLFGQTQGPSLLASKCFSRPQSPLQICHLTWSHLLLHCLVIVSSLSELVPGRTTTANVLTIPFSPHLPLNPSHSDSRKLFISSCEFTHFILSLKTVLCFLT